MDSDVLLFFAKWRVFSDRSTVIARADPDPRSPVAPAVRSSGGWLACFLGLCSSCKISDARRSRGGRRHNYVAWPGSSHLLALGRAMSAEAQPGSAGEPGRWFESDPVWFKRALFYEIHLRGFFDGNDDGAGDFRGLIDKLDYLQWLGIDCIWLLPMFASPLRDGGYDIADFYTVHPDYGTIEDVRALLEAAHRRGIRVIADLVMNHTSSDHPWFQESRSSPDSPEARWYVWSHEDTLATRRRGSSSSTLESFELDPGPRSLAPTTGTASSRPAGPRTTTTPRCGRRCSRCFASGSTSASTASASTRCPTSMNGTGRTARTCPRHTRSSREVRAAVDADYPDRVLLAEANQWPADVESTSEMGRYATWRSTPDHAALFMALSPRGRDVDRWRVLRNTPAIPDNCQWGR